MIKLLYAMDWGRNKIVRCVKTSGSILSRRPIYAPKFMKLGDDVGTPPTFQSPCSVVHAVFRSEGIRHSVSKSPKNQTTV